MSTHNGTLETLTRSLAGALAPLLNAIESPETMMGFLEELGWQAPDNLVTFGIDPNILETMIVALQDLLVFESQNPDSEAIAEKYAAVLTAATNAARHIYELQSNIGDHIDSAYLNASDIASELPRRLFDYLIIEFLMENHPIMYYSLIAIGLIELNDIPRDDDTFTSEHTRRIVNYSRLTKIITDPGGLFADVYDWGTSEADLKLLLERLYDLVLIMDLPASMHYPDYIKEANLCKPAIVPEDEEAENPELRIPILYQEYETNGAEAGITIMPVSPVSDGQAPGLAICPYATGALEASIPLDSQGNWVLTLTGVLDLVVGIGLIFRPGQTLKILTDIMSTVSNASGHLTIDLCRQALPGKSIPLLGTATGTGLSAESLYGKIALVAGTGQNTDFSVELMTEGGKLRLDFSSVDSFLASILPGEPLDILFDFGIGWSNNRGLYLTGGAGFEYSSSVHKKLGPLTLEIIHFGFKFIDDDIRIFMAISGGAALGPLCASVESIGMEMALSFPQTGGNLGPANLDMKFMPPKGLGLAIDAGVVKGGGYLYFDFDKEEYAGALELELIEFLSIKAVGIITTRMPDGSKGFSLLLIITSEFGSPIQLGLGFTLSGVGGLLGLNRTMLLEPLAEGIRSGGINSVMFPTNVVENAPRIINDLKTFFPPQNGVFLIGPMAKIGWSTPNLVTLSLGIIIEIPGNIAIVGILKVVLPDEEAAVLRLQINFIGAIEFDKKRAWFYASIYDSRLLTMTIEGQMGVLIAWGNDANFVISVGGFHPAFKAPPLPFPKPDRITITILNKSWAKVSVEGYFAVTSNTVQFGAKAELFFSLSAFEIDGDFSFDALFRFSPFYFTITISASLSVKACGASLMNVRISGSLEGPTPWHVEGKGSISLLFFDIDVDFSYTWGKIAITIAQPVAVMPLLKAEYEKPENWKTEVSAANKILVSLRRIEANEDIILHPVGTLKVSQRSVPLDLTIDKLGTQKPCDANHFTLSVEAEDSSAEEIVLEKIDDVKEMFAMAQFKNMPDFVKLSVPAYEKKGGGLKLSAKGEQIRTSGAIKRAVRYEQIIIDTNYKRFVAPFTKFSRVLFNFFLKGSAAAKSVLSQKYREQKMPFAEKITIEPDLYAVASNTNNLAFDDESRSFAGYAEAQEHMNQILKEKPNLRDSLHVIPLVEMERPA